MKKFFTTVLCLLCMNQCLLASDDDLKPPLTVWIRSFGSESAKIIPSYLHQIDQAFSPYYALKILVATKPDDPVVKALIDINLNCPCQILQTNLSSISTGLNTLIDETAVHSYVLSLSQGVDIESRQVKDALSLLNSGAWAHGWQVSNLHNDGSVPGKGWYHTAVLYPPATVQWMKDHPFPYWIDNGVDGFLTIDGEQIPIGDNEEVVLMARVVKENTQAFFIHNNQEIVNLQMQTGNGITFEQKLKRKIFASDHYLKNRLDMEADEVWSHLLLMTTQGLINAVTKELVVFDKQNQMMHFSSP